MAGYSGTPLAKKLGIKPGSTLFLDGAPDDHLAPHRIQFRKPVRDHRDVGPADLEQAIAAK